MKPKATLMVLTLMLTLGLNGCIANPTNMDARTLHASEAQRAVSIQRGVVLSVEEVAVGLHMMSSILGLDNPHCTVIELHLYMSHSIDILHFGKSVLEAHNK